ncbi:diguanylate cyclase domain-containing protein [Kineococcus sp. SYSU DK004]|uniref:diguanylate cyclase domain-containing protein n=1 Tax=Kineococcus sp. SYSU DK004 TaxID=3383125 RepID=UPI003D7C61B1
MTGAADRRVLLERLAEEDARLQRRPGELALVLLALDDPARITGVAGRRAEDAVLAEVAARLQVQLRRTDLLARSGDHEFAVVLPGAGAAAAAELAQRLRAAVAAGPVAGWDVTVTTASAVHDPARGADGLLADAVADLRARR